MTRFEIADPRGIAGITPAAAAARLAGLSGARLLLIDNGKLAPAYHSMSAVGPALFAVLDDVHWGTFSRDFLHYHPSQIGALVDEICTSAPDAAVLALADAGVSVQTMLVAAELETRGIPTVVIATLLGEPACRALARPRMPDLPIVAVDIARFDSAGKVTQEIAAQRDRIVAALTEKPVAGDGAAEEAELRFEPANDGWPAMHEFQDWLESRELGDGLPLLPPTPETVAALLATVPFDPEELLYGPALTSGRSLRVRDAAVNAAMTGCPPPAFPVLVAALRAMAMPDFRLLQAAITTHPSGYLVVLSGTDPARFGMSGGAGCLGPGRRGNLAVGRTVSLAVQHLFGARPGAADLTSFGSPAEIAYCMAEDTGRTGWPMQAADRGFDGPAVLVVKAEGPRNVLEHLSVTPAALCDALVAGAASACGNNAFIPGDLVVMLNPEHSRILVDHGWTRRDLALALFQEARLPRTRLEGRGAEPFRPAFMDALSELPVTRSPEDIHIFLGGAPGPHSLVAPPWGYSRGQWASVVAC